MIGNKNSSKINSRIGNLGGKINGILLAGILLLGSPCTVDAAKIVVDAGHGGSDSGAVGVNGLQEKVVTLDIALKLKEELLLRGYEVALTRQDDRYISLADRVAMTTAANADLFVSVHANSNPSSAINGTQVLYYDNNYQQKDYPASDAMRALTPQSKYLAQMVLKNVLSTAKLADKGLIPSAVYVVRMGQIPSILVETAFLSNWNDAAVLMDNTMRQKFVTGIADGIQAVLPPPPPPEPAEFADLQKHWAKDAVVRLKDKGIVESQKVYYPDRPITRAELLTMLNRQFNFGQRIIDLSKLGTIIPVFKDLPSSHWSYAVINNALALGYVDGYSDQTIRPDQPVTRAEAAVLLQRIMQPPNVDQAVDKPADLSKPPALPVKISSETNLPTEPVKPLEPVKPDKPPVDTGFSDVASDNWAASAIVQLSQKGLINGVADKKFAPDKNMTRAEMAVLLDRVK